MRSTLVYILIKCAFIGSFAKNDGITSGRSQVTLTNQYFEKEAKNDIEHVLSAGNDAEVHIFQDEYDDYEKTAKTYTPQSNYRKPDVILDNLQEMLKHLQIQKRVRTPVVLHKLNKRYLRKENKADSLNSVDTNRLIEAMEKLVNSENTKSLRNSKDKKYSFNKKHLRYAVDDAVETPDDHPVLKISEGKYNAKKYAADRDAKNDSDNTDDKKEEKQRLEKKSSHLKTLYKLSKQFEHLRKLQSKPNSFKDLRSNSKFLDINKKDQQKFMNLLKKRIKVKGNLRNLPKTSTNYKKQQSILRRLGDAQDSPAKRYKRSTEAGYTQNPDTCKTYNDNLAQLWSNLSKHLNITEQPNEKALHNIAIIIQAYLEHQNAQPSPDIHKVKHESRDKIGDVIAKIRKQIFNDEADTDKITLTITSNLVPRYEDSNNEDCAQINDEYLRLSIDILYKSYLENNVKCLDDADTIAQNSLSFSFGRRKQSGRDLVINHPPLVDTEENPDIKNILIEDELYNDYHKGKVPRQLPNSNKNRRVIERRKENKNDTSHSIRSSENQKAEDKLILRSKSTRKPATRKLGKSICQRSAIRKLLISLRPVLERFMGLQECKVDNTMRSLNDDNRPNNRYYLHASNYIPSEDSQTHIQGIGRSKLTRKNTEGSIRKYKSHDTGHENDRNVLRHDTKFGTSSQKYRLSRVRNRHSATPTLAKNTDNRKLQSDISKANVNDEYNTYYEQYYQSVPMYNNYDATYKADNKKTYPIMINSEEILSFNNNDDDDDKMTARTKLTNKEKGQRGVKVDYEDYILEYADYILEYADIIPVTGQSFKDLDEYRKYAQNIKAKSKIHANRYESMSNFLKRARDRSVQAPEFVIPFALNTNKGYVELTHLVKYPKILVYRPQFIVKNTMPYDDFLRSMHSFNLTGDDTRLLKIVRYFPDNRVQVLFESADFDTPFEVQDLTRENRKIGSSDTLKAYRSQNYKDEANVNANAEFTNDERKEITPTSTSIFSSFLRDSTGDKLDESDRHGNKEYLSSNSDSESISYSSSNSESNANPIFRNSMFSFLRDSIGDKLDESDRHGSKEYLSSSSDSKSISYSSSNSETNANSISRSSMFTSSPTSSSIPSSILGLDTFSRESSDFSSSSNLDSNSGSMNRFGFYFNSVARPEISSTTQSSSSQKPQTEYSYNPVPIINTGSSNTNPLTSILSEFESASDIPITDLTGIKKLLSPSINSNLVSWWKTWKDKVTKEIKIILGKVDSLGNKLKYIVKAADPTPDKILDADNFKLF
ncbi:uncharacterized protein LOC110371487 [Helicoverpa armigera]|uniref:uncharacterized protein LOC110371487 n=1 Tax=Helicoverpa armigera TaxID=29058 RepID=UPI003083BFFC